MRAFPFVSDLWGKEAIGHSIACLCVSQNDKLAKFGAILPMSHNVLGDIHPSLRASFPFSSTDLAKGGSLLLNVIVL